MVCATFEWRWFPVSDELDDYEEGVERAEAQEDELEQELVLADAAEVGRHRRRGG